MHKILIIPRKEERNLYNLLPLIKGIEIYFNGLEEDFKIHFLHNSDLSKQTALLKGRLNFHVFEEKKLGPLGSLKVAQKQNDLFNLSHSFCFRDDVGAVTLNKYLKAKNRYGYDSLQGKLVNTHTLSSQEGMSDKDYYYKLVEHFLKVPNETTVETLKGDLKNYSEVRENFFKAQEIPSFIFLAFDKIEAESEAHLLLQNMVNNFDQNIYLWVEEMTETAHHILTDNSKVLDISEVDPRGFDAYLEKCLGVITNEEWVSEMASYFGVDSLLFECDSFVKRDFPHPNVTLVQTRGAGIYDLLIIDGEELIKEVNIDKLADHIHEAFSL